MQHQEISEDIRNSILVLIQNDEYVELENYFKLNNISLDLLNNDNFDILLYTIENSSSNDTIKYIIKKVEYKNFNYHITVNDAQIQKVKSPLFLAVGKNNFEMSNLFLNNKADISYLNYEIINCLLNQNLLNNKNLKFILRNGYDIKGITQDLINKIIDNSHNNFLEIILNHFKFDNKFILSLLNLYKNKIALNDKQFQKMILKEKEKIIINEEMYKKAIEKENFDMVRILFENDSSRDTKLLRRIIKYDILELAVKSNNYSFVEKILNYETFNYKSFNYETILSKSIENNNINITKLLIKCFLKNSYELDIKKAVEKENDEAVNDTNKSKYLTLLLNFVIKMKNIELVKYLIEEVSITPSLDIKSKDINEEYPIITTLYSNDIEIFKYLLEHGADCNTKNNNRISLLLLTIHNNKYEMLKELMEYEVNINEKDINGNTPLMKSINQNNEELVELLIDYGNDNEIPININNKNEFNNYPLFQAIKYNNLDTVISLINYGVDHNIDMNIQDENGNTPLTLSYKLGYKKIFKYLVKYLDINQKDSKGKSVLFYVIDKEDEEYIKYLINIGADINLKDSLSNCILDYAIKKGNISIIKILLQKFNINVNEINSEGDTPILSLIKSDKYKVKEKEEIVNKLIEKGCDINFVNKESKSSLIYAINKSYVYITKLLLNNGATIDRESENFLNELNQFGLNIYNDDITITFDSMESLIKNNQLKKFKWLIDYFDVNEKNSKGDTLLHRAISYRNIDFINYLVKNCHADKYIRNNQGYSAFGWNDHINYNYSIRNSIKNILNSY